MILGAFQKSSSIRSGTASGCGGLGAMPPGPAHRQFVFRSPAPRGALALSECIDGPKHAHIPLELQVFSSFDVEVLGQETNSAGRGAQKRTSAATCASDPRPHSVSRPTERSKKLASQCKPTGPTMVSCRVHRARRRRRTSANESENAADDGASQAHRTSPSSHPSPPFRAIRGSFWRSPGAPQGDHRHGGSEPGRHKWRRR